MSRREYPVADRYDERESEFYRRPRRDRDREDFELDITRSRGPERRTETIVRERDTSVSRRSERPRREPDFLREDYGRSSAGQLVVREEKREDDVYSRAPTRRRSVETVRSRAPPERVVKDEYILKERDRSDRGLPYPRSQRSEIDYKETDREEIVYRERARSRPPQRERSEEKIDITIRRDESELARPPPRRERSEEKIDITIRRDESERPRPPPPRSEIRERDVEEIRFRRGGGDRPPPRVIEKEEIEIRESRSPAPPPPRSVVKEDDLEIDIRRSGGDRRGREGSKEEIDINIRERSAPPPRQRSMSRGALVARKEEEWIVRRPRTPPPRDYEKEEIIIRRKEKDPEPEPPREPTPEPPPPVLEPIYRPPIIQEYITHHRHIDHGVERARSPTPPPPPPSPPREEELEIEIKRKGVRNGKAYEEDIIIDREMIEGKGREREREVEREVERDVSRRRSVSVATRRRSPSRGRYEDDLSAEADYYNRKVSSRAYPGEAYNGATKDWGLVDVPPGTERVRMDGIGGGSQEITWQRYNGERRGKFVTGDRTYESEFGNGYHSPPPLPPAPEREVKEEIKITETRTEEKPRRKREKMWTEVTKDLVIKEAIDEMGYEFEETDQNYYIIEYLKYEDVLRLVEITEDIRRERKQRIRELQWERERAERAPKMLLPPPPAPAPPRSRYDERVFEREIIYDRDRRYR